MLPQASAPAFSGGVLIGGKSRRMGFDKAALLVGGQSLLWLQLERLRAVGAKELLVADSADAPRSKPGMPSDIHWVRDQRSGVGPMAGLEALLGAAAHEHLLVLAVDLPVLDVAFLCKLIAGLAPDRGRVPFLWEIGDRRSQIGGQSLGRPVLRTRERGEPLCAVYPRGLAAAAVAIQIAAGAWALQDLVLRGIRDGWMERWDVSEAESRRLTNWNRPGDWQQEKPTGAP